MTQHIRLSQFVVTYGPGTILEGPGGPRIIPSPAIGLFHSGSGITPGRFEISDQRMSQGLLGGARIFRLPSNAELGIPERKFIYRTKPFPSWSLCLNTGSHGSGSGVLYQGSSCPQCGIQGRRRQETIRFIRACPEGHLDDIDWHSLVHGNFTCGHTSWFEWYGGGGSLSQVEIRCPRCRHRMNLGRAYGQTWSCSGRLPEKEPLNSPPIRLGCSRRSRIIQRQASNLRIPELRTLFTIPPRATRLHNLLELPPVRAVLFATGASSFTSPSQFQTALSNLVQGGFISQAIVDEIMRHPWPEIQQAIRDALSPVRTQFQDLLLEEFHALIDASEHGYPPVHGSTPSSPIVFEVNPAGRQVFPGPNGRNFRITPVPRLRTVTVQVAYRREIPIQTPTGEIIPSSPINISFPDPVTQHPWFPGVEFLGEGVFIMLDDNEGWHFPLVGPAVQLWHSSYTEPAVYPLHLFRTGVPYELHLVFVWWHTLSHLLIRAISVDAGYSSAAIRERIYIEIDQNTDTARSGIILYATQPGSEGSLGGLIALVSNFDRVLAQAFDMARICSNDPLCLDTHFTKYSGSSCYGCLLISETSCEHRNLWLDRKVLLNNLP